MSEAEKKPKKVKPTFDRMVLDEEVKQKFGRWLDQVKAKHGTPIRVSRGDLLNVIALRHSEDLSAHEIKAVWERCFDTVEFAKQVANELVLARKNNETVTIEQVIDRLKSAMPVETRLPKSRATKVERQGVEVQGS